MNSQCISLLNPQTQSGRIYWPHFTITKVLILVVFLQLSLPCASSPQISPGQFVFPCLRNLYWGQIKSRLKILSFLALVFHSLSSLKI